MKKEENKTVIFGVKVDDKYHYIGKTETKLNSEGKINKSDCHRQYLDTNIRQVFTQNEQVEVEPIQIIEDQFWYDEKLKEVVQKHQEDHPLLNAQWMLEGKRGYWEGKKRDEHTLRRLSESKYKRVVEYDVEGYRKKVWKSGKDVAVKIIGDYRVINGSAESRIYDILNYHILENRFQYGSYWFKEEELIRYFNTIPKKINIQKIIENQKKRRSEGSRRGQENRTMTSRYSVIQYNHQGEEIDRFLNTEEAAYRLKIHVATVRRMCNGTYLKNKYIFYLEYGERILQPYKPQYPKYKIKPLKLNPKVRKQDMKYRTRRTVVYKGGNDHVIEIFPDVEVASKKLKISETDIRAICNGKINSYVNLEYGKTKKQYKK